MMNIKTNRTLSRVTLATLLAGSVTLGGCVVAPRAPRIHGDVVVGVAPGPGMVWFDGGWAYGARGRYWRPGHWGRYGH